VNDRLQRIQALAQRGLSDLQILLAIGIDSFTDADRQAIEKGRAAGVALVNNKLFDRAMDGDPKAIEILNGKLEDTAKRESYVEKQLRILRELRK
jgi:hypothetical protein